MIVFRRAVLIQQIERRAQRKRSLSEAKGRTFIEPPQAAVTEIAFRRQKCEDSGVV